jgi:signal peptidase II
MKRVWELYRYMLAVTAGVVIVDQLSKAWVRANLALGEAIKPFPELLPTFRIMNWENDGSAFGFFGGSYTIYIVMSLVAILAIIIYFPRVKPHDWSLRWCLIFLIAGVTGNLIDRIHQGYVTDLIAVYEYYVFNVADLSNFAGVLILFLGVIKGDEKKPEADSLAEKET